MVAGKIIREPPIYGGLQSNRTTWPLFWCLSVESHAALMKFQLDKYGQHLVIPPLPKDVRIDTKLKSLEEIDRLMRRKPRYPKGVEL